LGIDQRRVFQRLFSRRKKGSPPTAAKNTATPAPVAAAGASLRAPGEPGEDEDAADDPNAPKRGEELLAVIGDPAKDGCERCERCDSGDAAASISTFVCVGRDIFFVEIPDPFS
jgi:hypothetical protein